MNVNKNLKFKTIFTIMKNMLYVFLGGGIGSALRYALFLMIPVTTFPYATFVVNILGSFLIGWLLSFYNSSSAMSSSIFLLLTTGLCGGFTTFSTFSKEGFLMIQQQQWLQFILYTLSSIIFCLLATAFGFYIGK
jgi:fluoride exporter